jgi:nucleoside-diphosphate-sugar epimerase
VKTLNVIVAGGAGFIGSHLCAALVQAGHSVRCIDNLSTGSAANLDGLRREPRFTFEQCDVQDVRAQSADLVLHLASPASPVQYRRLSLETMAANSLGTWRLLDLAHESGARFVFASTSEVYGEPLVHPQPESYHGNVNPNGIRACYDEAKRFGEALTFEHARRYSTNVAIVRIFNTYGPRMASGDGRVIPAFIEACLAGRPIPIEGDGHQTRSFCYVDDLVRGLLAVALDRDARSEVFNIGNPAEYTIRELAEIVAEAAHVPLDLDFAPAAADSPTRRRPDIAKVRSRYGWSPCTPLREGIGLTLADFAGRAARVSVAAQ